MNIGIPENFKQKNKFEGIKKGVPQRQNKGKYLNKLVGAKATKNSGVNYVDGKKHNKMGKNEFLKLLSHQLQNQDPLKPMDQNKFAAELAQFSQLEQLSNINTSLSSMGKNAPIEHKFFGASFIGKQVVTSGSTVNYKGSGDRPNLSFNLKNDARNVIVRLLDKRNQTIQQFNLEGLGKGIHTLQWDGKALDGSLAGKGIYKISVNAWGHDLSPIKSSTGVTGIVTAVNFKDGETLLTVDGKKRVFLRDVSSFHSSNQNNGKVKLNPENLSSNRMNLDFLKGQKKQ